MDRVRFTLILSVLDNNFEFCKDNNFAALYSLIVRLVQLGLLFLADTKNPSVNEHLKCLNKIIFLHLFQNFL